MAKFLDTLGGQLAGSAAGSAATGLLSGATDALFGGISARRQWKYQQKAMDKQQGYNERNMQLQFDYAKKAFDMENEYNDPRNSTARWRAAGISPNAVFGASPGGSGVSGSMTTPDSSNPNASGPDGGRGYAPVMTLAEAQQLRNQKRLTDAEVKLKAAQAREADSRATGQDNTNSIFDLLKTAASLENDNKSLQNDILSIQRDYEERKQQGVLGDLAARIDELISRKDLNEETRSNLIETRSLIQAQISTEGAKRRNIDSDTRLKNSQTSLNRHQISKVLTEVRRLGVELKDAQYDLLLRELDSEPVTSAAGFLDRLSRAIDREITPEIRDRINDFWNSSIK